MKTSTHLYATDTFTGHRTPARGLDETLKLIRGHSGHHRPKSGSPTQQNHISPRQSYTDALNRPYFNKYSSHRPTSPPEKTDNQIKNRLHNNSLRNLTNSKSLFEQQLEQQQRMIADQQKQTINEFNNAVMKEIQEGKNGYVGEDQDSLQVCDTDSLSSVDSLERSQNCDSNRSYTGEPMHVDHANHQESTLRTDTSNIMTRDTHQNVRDVSAQLNTNYSDPLLPNSVSNNMGQIDSYNVDQTQMPQPVTHVVVKSDFQSTYQSGNKSVENRPKVQLRAWATPSPVDSAHVSRPPNVPMTNTNPYTPRNTMTTVTMTTVYDENRPRTVQSNGWPDERSNLQSQYSAKMNGDVNGVVYTDTCGNENFQELNSNIGIHNEQRTGGKNLEFLETVTNTLDKKDNNMASKPPPAGNVSKPQPQGPSRLPRPVSAVNKASPNGTQNPESANTSHIESVSSKARLSSFTTTNPVQPGSPRTFNTYGGALQNNVGTVRTQTKSYTTNGTLTNGDENQKVFINTVGSERPPVRQVTNVKFAASVVNGNVHMNNYGKLQVLPDKPAILTRQNSEGDCRALKKVSDDSDLGRDKANMNGLDSLEIKGILKRPGGMRTLRRAGSTGSVNSGFDVKDSIEIAKATIQTQNEKKQVRILYV